jgi:hypothetical protein
MSLTLAGQYIGQNLQFGVMASLLRLVEGRNAGWAFGGVYVLAIWVLVLEHLRSFHSSCMTALPMAFTVLGDWRLWPSRVVFVSWSKQRPSSCCTLADSA